MECKNITINSKNISIFFIGDVHVGNACFDEEAFKRDIKMIAETAKSRTVIVIGMGDYVDAITVDDKKRFSPSEIDSNYTLHDLKDLPRRQMKYFFKLIEPIKEYFKFAFIGNHEESYIKYNSFDLYDYLCNDLIGGCVKLGYSGFLGLTLLPYNSDEKPYSSFVTINGTHGNGGGGFLAGYTRSNMMEIFRYSRANVYVMGHVHHMDVYSPSLRSMSKNTKTINTNIEHYITNGCYLRDMKEGVRNYFEGKKGTPPDIGCVELQYDFIHKDWFSKCIMHKHP